MAVPAPIDQKSYLQKYLKGTSGDKKKKKRKNIKGKGFKIIDDDIDVSRLQPLDIDELDILGEGEDAPQIAGIIDDRPEELKKSEQFISSKWRVINQDDGFTSKLEIEEIKQTIKEKEKENEIIFGKMYSDSEDENKNDSDLSPPRKQSGDKPKESAKRSDSDNSPPRQNSKQHNNRSRKRSQSNDDSDLSPPRKHSMKTGDSRNKNTNEVKVRKRSRWESVEDIERNKSHKNQTEHSRKSKKDSSQRGKSSESDMSPPRKSKKSKRKNSESPKRRDKSDSDMSPPRKNNLNRSVGKSRKSSSESDSDMSPPRKSKNSKRKNSESPKRRNKSDSDMSPPRKNNLKKSSKSRNESDSDMSPPRKSKESYERRSRYDNDMHRNKRQDKRNKSSDSDLSPPRKNRQESPHRATNRHSPRRDRRINNDNASRRDRVNRSDSPPPSNKKMEKTLEGKRAGLQNAKELKIENEEFRRREDNAFSTMNDEVSGRNAKAVSRKSKRETSEERQKQKEKADRQRELDEKYKKWSKGIKQIEVQEARVQEMLHEASKPLARFKDDRDLERDRRDIEREGDPMLQYIRERKRERGELPPEKPTYKGSFPPNRFNIRPGYRWDGVDRSSGYEKKYFEQKSKRKAQEDEAYMWSMEDL